MDFSFGRDIALIWLSVFCVVGLVVPIVALYFVVRGMNIAQKKSIELLQQGQAQVKNVRQQTERISAQAVQPVIRAQSKVAQAKATIKKIPGVTRFTG